MTYEITTTSSDQTQSLARSLAPQIQGGATIELASDLGGGKTTFVQGLAAGLGYAGRVSSPTFTLSNVYELSDGRSIHHYDLYRLDEGGIVGQELAEDMADPDVITLIEWAGVAQAQLPQDRLIINFNVAGEHDRHIVFSGQGDDTDRVIKALQS